MNPLIYALIAAIGISLISLIGVLFLGLNKNKLENFLFWMVSFSAGALMGGAFFHLLPESLEKLDSLVVFEVAMIGFIIFFVLERLLRWHHCHKIDCDTHKVLGYQNLIGDSIHNFIDGLVLISAFAVSIPLGIAVTFSIMLHEIPQEIGDFGVLVYSGFSKKKAIMFNLLSAGVAIVGVLVGYLMIKQGDIAIEKILPFAAGGFIYIAASDLIPELHREKNNRKAWFAFLFFLLAVFFMLLLVE